MQSEGAISVGFYDEGSRDSALLQLLVEAFGEWPRGQIPVAGLDHLRWKLSSPGAAGNHLVATANGQLIGCRLAMGRQTKIDGRILDARFGIDTAVHPDWRRRGVLEVMRRYGAEHLNQRFDMGTGMTNHPTIVRKDLRDGLRGIGNVIEVLERGTHDAAADAGTRPTGVRVREATAFDSRADELWERASAPFRVAVVRRADYLNWRYADPRAGGFRILFAEEDYRLLGYASICVRGDGKGNIADLFAEPERNDVLDALVAEATSRLRELGASRVQVWCATRHPYWHTVVRAGFALKRRLDGLHMRGYKRELREAVSIAEEPSVAIHFSSGDTDLV